MNSPPSSTRDLTVGTVLHRVTERTVAILRVGGSRIAHGGIPCHA